MAAMKPLRCGLIICGGMAMLTVQSLAFFVPPLLGSNPVVLESARSAREIDTQNESFSLRMSAVQDLSGRVCLVTGASRGIGKGIAKGLGERGATVYITGRSLGESTDEKLGGTLEETKAEVEQAGGKCIPLKCDHSRDSDVQAVVDQIQKEEGKLDLLVNNAFAIPQGVPLIGKFWEQGAAAWDAVHTVGLRSHYVASCLAMPLLMKSAEEAEKSGDKYTRMSPLIVNVGSFGGVCYTFNVAYGVGKAGVDRLTADMDIELKNNNVGVNVVSLWPGVVKTEKVLDLMASGKMKDTLAVPEDLAETPLFAGRAVAALAADTAASRMRRKSGKVQVVAELADQYGFVDADGSKPPSIRSLKFLFPGYLNAKLPEKFRLPEEKIPNILLPFSFMSGQPPK